MRMMQRALLALGALATLPGFVFLFAGFSRGNAPAGEILKAVLLLAGLMVWTLSPYWALFMLQRAASPTRARDMVLLAASALVATLAVGTYLPTFVFTPRVRPSASAVTLMFIPAYQWVFASVAWVVCALLPSRAGGYSRR